MNENDDLIEITLYGGPKDGEMIQIHKDNLQISPRISLTDDSGNSVVYAPNSQGDFVWLPEPEKENSARSYFVFKDDGTLLSEENSVEEAQDKLDDLENEGWKYE